MTKLYLFEAGSSKTTLLVCNFASFDEDEAGIKEFTLPGYNPNRDGEAFLQSLQTLAIQENDRVYFYGSGLASTDRKADLKSIFTKLFKTEIVVYDDILGAARALYKNQSGVFAILGTGGVVGYYNGNTVVARKGGYGYLIDDTGGGYELGKRLVSAWLNNDLPVDLQREMEGVLQSNRLSFTQKYYSDSKLAHSAKGLKQIADTVKLVPKYLENEFVKYLVEDYFAEFFKRHVQTLMNAKNENELKICGTIAEIFHESIQKVATEFGLFISQSLRYPALNLLDYHLRELNEKK